MELIPKPFYVSFLGALERERISENQRGFYIKWLRYYLDFCQKHTHLPLDSDSPDLFMRKLGEKGQSAYKQKQAADSIRIYLTMREQDSPKLENTSSEAGSIADVGSADVWRGLQLKLKKCIQTKQYSPKTLSACAGWAKKFQGFLESKNPQEVDAGDAAEFFTYLATVKKVAASTLNQAFNALLFLFRNVLGKEFEGFDGVARAKPSKYVPVVLSRSEVHAVFEKLKHPHQLMVKILYGCGLRLFECVNIRINWLDFESMQLTVHDGKGRKGRVVPMPKAIEEDVRRQVAKVRGQLARDLAAGFDGAFMPEALGRKFKQAAKELPWQWLFPARNLTYIKKSDEQRRHHAYESHLGNAIRKAARETEITKRVTAHTFRHSFASHLLLNRVDIVTIQKLLGHTDLKTTMIYTQTVPSMTITDAISPLDLDF